MAAPRPVAPPPGYISIANAVKRLKVSRPTLYKLMEKKKLESKKVGPNRFISCTSVVKCQQSTPSERDANG